MIGCTERHCAQFYHLRVHVYDLLMSFVLASDHASDANERQ